MVALNFQNLQGVGLYTPQQAARLARMRTQTANQWLSGRNGKPAIHRYLDENEHDLLGFVDMIQMVGVRNVRRQKELSLQAIRNVVAVADSLGYPYPFARNCKVYKFGKEVVLKLPGEVLIGASGRLKFQHLMEPVLLPYLRELTFGSDGLVREYRPMPQILLSPSEAWGAPVVEHTGYTVETLVSSAIAEGSVEQAAEMCGVTVEQVQDALRYEEYLSGAA